MIDRYGIEDLDPKALALRAIQMRGGRRRKNAAKLAWADLGDLLKHTAYPPLEKKLSAARRVLRAMAKEARR